jgi:hypothetical protein
MAPSNGVPYGHGPFSLSKMKHYGLQHRPFRLTWGFLQSMLRATAHPAVVTIASCHIGIAIVPRNVFFGNNGMFLCYVEASRFDVRCLVPRIRRCLRPTACLYTGLLVPIYFCVLQNVTPVLMPFLGNCNDVSFKKIGST